MSTLYEGTIILSKDNYDKAKEQFEDNGVFFETTLKGKNNEIIATFTNNGSLYDNYEDWFENALKSVIAYEENCIETEPYFFGYINGEWEEDEQSILRRYYKVPQYANEEETK